MANVALENIGWRLAVDISPNIFKINGYEYLRIGVGYQSLNLISERLRFGGYLGYATDPQGINDNGWRVGFNSGIYWGKCKRQYLEYKDKHDPLEPGRTFTLMRKNTRSVISLLQKMGLKHLMI